MNKPDHPICTTCKHIAALFTGYTIKDNSNVWLAAPQISDTFIQNLKEEWKKVRTTQIPKDFTSRNKKREALNISFTVDGLEVFPKLYTRKDYKHILLHSFFFSEARRNFTTMCYLKKHNLLTPEPLAILSGNRSNPQQETVLFTQKLAKTDLHFYDFREQLKRLPQVERNSFFMQYAIKMAELHNLGIYTEDTDKNISVRPRGDAYEFYFYDFDNFYPWRYPNTKRTQTSLLRSIFCDNHYNATREEALMYLDTYVTVRQCHDIKPQLLEAIEERLARINA